MLNSPLDMLSKQTSWKQYFMHGNTSGMLRKLAMSEDRKVWSFDGINVGVILPF